ncbi:glycosyltransferase family 2 protein [Litoreibacter janthinus]|uniref:glycosyltransferase family 2 protein n=1 Tax=Litoreibacter janthinus TaxID=670154 RepID=UPI000B7E32D2|nr:hypothetical protein [Litoreibacter janthinus]
MLRRDPSCKFAVAWPGHPSFRAGLSEDYDWCQRAASHGFKLVYDPNLVVDHPCRATWDELRSKWRRITSESYGLHQAQGRAKALWLVRALLMPLSISFHMPRILRSPKLKTGRERTGALITLTRLRLWRMIAMIRVALVQDPAKTN